MRKVRIHKPSPAMVVACAALFTAMSGVGYAAVVLPKNSVGTAQLKAGAVRAADIYRNAVNGAKIKNDSVSGADVNEATLGQVPSAASAGTAANAANADNATNAAALGGEPASAYAKAADALTQAQANALYLGKSDKAADANTLDGADSTAFAAAGHNHNSSYLGINAKATDADRLDGIDSAGYVKAGQTAGGDLQGTYPNPSIRNGEAWRAVGTSGQPGFELGRWGNFGSGQAVTAFRKDVLGVVHLKGLAQYILADPLAGCPRFIFVLPAGYRPSENLVFSSVRGENYRLLRIDVAATGHVSVCPGGDAFQTNDWFSLSGITFRAEQ